MLEKYRADVEYIDPKRQQRDILRKEKWPGFGVFFWVVFLQTGLPVRGSYSFEKGACSGRMNWRLSPGLFSCKRDSGFSECFGPHDGFSARMISGLSQQLSSLSTRWML